MLDKNKLYNAIMLQIQSLAKSKDIHNKIAKVINEYILNNLQVVGVYVGTIPSVPPIPDPISGNVTFKMSSSNVVGGIMQLQSKLGIDAWYSGICMMISTTTIVNPKSPTVTIIPTLVFSTIIPSILNVKNETNSKDIWKKISSTLISDILMSIPIPTPIPTTSTSGGFGSTSFLKFK